MLKKDFISKIIEQIVDSIAKILKIDHEKQAEEFLLQMEIFLQTYFQISSENLNSLLESDDKNDAYLHNEQLNNFYLNLFAKAGLAYFHQGKKEQANICLQIISEIQKNQSNIFQFPSDQSIKIETLIKELQQNLKNHFNESNR